MGKDQDSFATRWITHKLDNPVINKTRKEVIMNVLGEILELGYSNGINLSYYPRGISRITATGKQDVIKRQDRIEVNLIYANVLSLPFEDNSFDTVISNFQLGFTNDPVKALSEIRRVLRPHGRLLLMELCGLDSNHAKKINTKASSLIAFTGGVYGNRNYLKLVQEAGFLVAESKLNDSTLTPRTMIGKLCSIIAVKR